MTAFKTESCAGQYKICIETENEELIEQCELTDEDAIYQLETILADALERLEHDPNNDVWSNDVKAIKYAIKAIKDRAALEEKHWSECRQIAHYDNELNCKDGKDWNRTIGV